MLDGNSEHVATKITFFAAFLSLWFHGVGLDRQGAGSNEGLYLYYYNEFIVYTYILSPFLLFFFLKILAEEKITEQVVEV